MKTLCDLQRARMTLMRGLCDLQRADLRLMKTLRKSQKPFLSHRPVSLPNARTRLLGPPPLFRRRSSRPIRGTTRWRRPPSHH